MFGYLTEVLHFSEATAFRRIAVARAARTVPLLLERIREGALHVAGAKLLAPTLTPETHVELLDLARHKSKRLPSGLGGVTLCRSSIEHSRCWSMTRSGRSSARRRYLELDQGRR